MKNHEIDRNCSKYAVLGVDLGTQHIGLAQISMSDLIAVNMNLTKISSHKTRRKMIWKALAQFNPSIVVFENVRLFHGGFINVDVVKRLGGLTYMIIDYYDCPTYSIDVRSWRKLILGKGQLSKEEKKLGKSVKQDSLDYVKKYGIYTQDDNLSDAVCIAECGFRYFEKLKEIE